MGFRGAFIPYYGKTNPLHINMQHIKNWPVIFNDDDDALSLDYK